MYNFESRVRYSEVGKDARINAKSIINYLQDCSIFHSEEAKVGVDYLKTVHRAWLLASWQIIIDRYPKLGEKITTYTNPYESDRFFAKRNFMIKDENGEICVRANSIWIFVDTEKFTPVRLKPEDIEPFLKVGGEYGEKLDMDYAPRKIKAPNDTVSVGKVTIDNHHLDTNGHVNNSRYISFAMKQLEPDEIIREIRVEYRREAIFSDTLDIGIKREPGKVTTVLRTESGDVSAVVELYLVQ